MKKLLSFGLVWGICFTLSTLAQDSLLPTQMGFSELIAQAEFSLNNGNPRAAIPLLKEIMTRAGSLKDSGAKKSVQMARLQLGSSYSALQKWADARFYVEQYFANEPVQDQATAYNLLCRISQAEGNWQGLFDAATGILKDTEGVKARQEADRFLVQALFELGRHKEALDLLPKVLAKTKDAEHLRVLQIMQLRSLFEMGQMEQFIAALPELFRGEAREDVTLNLALLKMGDQLFDRQDYRKALIMYRLVLPKTTLLARSTERLERLGGSQKEELKKTILALEDVPDYGIHVDFRSAQIYSEHKRYWEAVMQFDQLLQHHADREEGEAAFFQKLLLLYQLGADQQANEEGMAYLETRSKGLYPRMVCTKIAQQFVQKKELKEALALLTYADRWAAPADSDERDQETSLRYLFSFIYFQLGEYPSAAQAFERVIQTDPKSQAAMDSNYWKAMCSLLQQNYEEAHTQFNRYRQLWPRASFASAALFRAGVCRFGLEDYEGAKQTFKSFIAEYPDDALMPEALTMYGDLLAADGEVDVALSLYDQAVALVTQNYTDSEEAESVKQQMVAPATYAVFRAAQLLQADAEAYFDQGEERDAEEKFRQLIRRTELYMKQFGDHADWAQGVFWIGKAQLELGEIDRAVDQYLDTVVQYGADPAQEGVIAILFDLANIIRIRMDEPQRADALLEIKQTRAAVQNFTLGVRFDVLLAELNGTEGRLGEILLKQTQALEGMPPSGLALMCIAASEQADFSRAEALFDHFAEHYEMSPFRVQAFRLRARALSAQKKSDEAFELALEALGLYGATVDTGWAQLVKGNVELERKDYPAATETFQMIFGVREWRGAVSAEAMFRMAEIYGVQGDLKKSFAFFQRTYLLFKAHEGGYWAAEAYLRSAECLQKMNRNHDARNTYRAMLLDKYVRDLPQAQVARDQLGPEEVAELLSGATAENAKETL